MKKFVLLLFLIVPFAMAYGQNPTTQQVQPKINRQNLTIRPNSRDYDIVRSGDNHQRVIQERRQSMMHYRQAMINRRMAMQRRRQLMQLYMIRRQQMKQRLIYQRGLH